MITDLIKQLTQMKLKSFTEDSQPNSMFGHFNWTLLNPSTKVGSRTLNLVSFTSHYVHTLKNLLNGVSKSLIYSVIIDFVSEI